MKKFGYLIGFGALAAVAGAIVGSRIAYKNFCTIKEVNLDKESDKKYINKFYSKMEPDELIKELSLDKEVKKDRLKASLIKALYTIGYPEKTIKKYADILEEKIINIIPEIDLDFDEEGIEFPDDDESSYTVPYRDEEEPEVSPEARSAAIDDESKEEKENKE